MDRAVRAYRAWGQKLLRSRINGYGGYIYIFPDSKRVRQLWERPEGSHDTAGFVGISCLTCVSQWWGTASDESGLTGVFHWGIPKTQLQKVAISTPRFPASCWKVIVLNAVLMSMNSIVGQDRVESRSSVRSVKFHRCEIQGWSLLLACSCS